MLGKEKCHSYTRISPKLSESALQAGKQDWQEQKALVNEPSCSPGRQQMVEKPEGGEWKPDSHHQGPGVTPDPPTRNEKEAHFAGGGYSPSN